MKKLFILLILALLVFLFFFSDSAALACRAGIELFVLRVLPSLLPFLIAGGTLSRLGAAQVLSKPFEKLFHKLFSLPGESAFVFATGILCGNPMGAQLIFTTHDTDLMNEEILRKDQLYFVDKDNSNGVSELYSISEFATKTSENIRKGYLVGKYGATPNLEIEEVL